MDNIEILNIRIDVLDSKKLKKKLLSILKGDKKSLVAKINSEFLLRGFKDLEFQKTINNADLNIADGIGVLWAAKYLSLPLTTWPVLRQIQAVIQMVYTGASLVFYPKYCRYPLSERIPGVDCFYLMLEVAQKNNFKVFLFGGEEQIIRKAVENLKKNFPGLKIAGFNGGYSYNDEEVIEKINNSKADLLFVNQGSPKQEYWIRDNLAKLETVKAAIGEGGTFDFVAGGYKRAPKWMQFMGLEWLFRLFANKNKTGVQGKRAKSRLGRIWQAIPVFIFYVVKFKLASKKKPPMKFKAKANLFDLFSFGILICLFLSVPIYKLAFKEKPASKLKVTVHVETPNADIIYKEALKKGQVYLNSVDNPVNLEETKENRDASDNPKSLDLTLSGEGSLSDGRYVFNGQRILINQKAEVRGNFFVQGVISKVEYANR